MTFPKPLGEKALQRMYRDAGLSEEKAEYLHSLFEGAANLYGSIMLSDLWQVYQTLTCRKPTIKIKKKELIAFSSIVRREKHDYFVFEIDELYRAEKRADTRRLLVINRLGAGATYTPYYNVVKAQMGKPFYVPGDLTEVKGPIITREEDALREYLENITASSPFVYDMVRGEKTASASPHQGKKLSEFVYHAESTRLRLEELKSMLGNCSEEKEEEIRKTLNYVNVPFSTTLMRSIRALTFNSKSPSLKDISSFIERDMENAGIVITSSLSEELEKFIDAFINNANLYINRGWSQKRLALIEEIGIENIGEIAELFGKEV